MMAFRLDFGSSFGTISQGVQGFYLPLAGANGAVPKVHILHARLQSSMSCPMYSMLLTLHLSVPTSAHLEFCTFRARPPKRREINVCHIHRTVSDRLYPM